MGISSCVHTELPEVTPGEQDKTKYKKLTEIQQKVPTDPRPLVWEDFSK